MGFVKVGNCKKRSDMLALKDFVSLAISCNSPESVEIDFITSTNNDEEAVPLRRELLGLSSMFWIFECVLGKNIPKKNGTRKKGKWNFSIRVRLSWPGVGRYQLETEPVSESI